VTRDDGQRPWDEAGDPAELRTGMVWWDRRSSRQGAGLVLLTSPWNSQAAGRMALDGSTVDERDVADVVVDWRGTKRVSDELVVQGFVEWGGGRVDAEQGMSGMSVSEVRQKVKAKVKVNAGWPICYR
jgi:hypothetical protein